MERIKNLTFNPELPSTFIVFFCFNFIEGKIFARNVKSKKKEYLFNRVTRDRKIIE